MPEPPLEEEFAEPNVIEEFENKAGLLVGNVYELLNKRHWGFGDNDGSSHPGACYDFDAQRREALLLKGTSKDPGRRYWAYVNIEPDDENGLTSTTYLGLSEIFEFRSRKIENAHHDRLRGKLSTGDLDSIRVALHEFIREDE